MLPFFVSAFFQFIFFYHLMNKYRSSCVCVLLFLATVFLFISSTLIFLSSKWLYIYNQIYLIKIWFCLLSYESSIELYTTASVFKNIKPLQIRQKVFFALSQKIKLKNVCYLVGNCIDAFAFFFGSLFHREVDL